MSSGPGSEIIVKDLENSSLPGLKWTPNLRVV